MSHHQTDQKYERKC